jgi:hypothetical protein
MNKLISKPTECGYRKQLFTRLGLPFGITCTHKDGDRACNHKEKFPINCPLSNGMTRKQWLEQQKPNIIHIKHKLKRRNRKNCVYYNYKAMCLREKLGVYCCGVTCGNFEKSVVTFKDLKDIDYDIFIS